MSGHVGDLSPEQEKALGEVGARAHGLSAVPPGACRPVHMFRLPERHGHSCEYVSAGWRCSSVSTPLWTARNGHCCVLTRWVREISVYVKY